jgi:hypothetical protein
MPKRDKFTEAVTAVEGYLLRHAPKGMTPKIYTYRELDARQRPFAGCIVAEVAFDNDRGGCSFMQVDVPWGIAVCGQTERCILAFVEDWPKDELDEELQRLSYCFTSAEVKS